MTQQEVLRKLDAVRSAMEELPEGTPCSANAHCLQLFRPDESEIRAMFGQDIKQRPFDDRFNERYVCVDGIKLIWLVRREPDYAQTT